MRHRPEGARPRPERRPSQRRSAVYRVNGKSFVGEPKTTESARTITLPASLVTELREHLVRSGVCSGVVFRSASIGLIDAGNFRTRDRLPVSKAAGLDGVTPHDLRHAHAHWLITANQHPKVIQKRLDHSSIQVTFDTFGSLFHGFDEGAAEAVDEAFQSARVPISYLSDA